MSVYVLDANVFAFVFKSGHQRAFVAAMEHVDCAVPEEVKDECNRWPDRRGQFEGWCKATRIEVVGMSPESAEGRLFRALHPNGDDLKDKGEHACIALVSADPARTLVTHDKGGCWSALRELSQHPQPVIAVFTFLRRLGDPRLLSRQAIGDIARIAVESNGRQNPGPPSWWDAWLLSVP